MNFKTPLFIALRYWRSKSGDRFGRLVANLASVGIVLGVMALVIVLSVMNGLENMQKRNLLSTLPHAVISSDLQKMEKNQPVVLPDFVQKSVPINRTNVIIQSNQGINAGTLIGVENATDDPLLAQIDNLPSRLPQGEFKLLIGSRLAEQLNLTAGDKLRLMITENSQYTPFGRVPVQRLFTIADIYYSHNEASEYTLFANLADVGRLLRLNEDQVQGVRLFLDDPFQVTDLAQYFLESERKIKLSDVVSNTAYAYPSGNNWKISDWREQKGEFFQAVRMEKNMMGLLISLIIVVAVSNIVTSLSLMVVDKQGEIAILQTQGLAKGQVMQIFVAQGAIVGIIGAIVGGILGWLATTYLGDVLRFINPAGVALPTEMDYTQVAMIVGGSMLLSLLCTLYPAYRAAKIEPAEALRYE